jgi:hypothetical protein
MKTPRFGNVEESKNHSILILLLTIESFYEEVIMRTSNKRTNWFNLLRGQLGVKLLIIVILAAVAAVPKATASVIVVTSIQESLTITPASGSINFFSGDCRLFDACYTLAIAQQCNSQGCAYSQSEQHFVTNSTSTASVTWTNAIASNQSSSLTALASNSIAIPTGPNGNFADSYAAGSYYESFSITGTSGPVSVQFSSVAPVFESIATAPQWTGFFDHDAFINLFDGNNNYIGNLSGYANIVTAGNGQSYLNAETLTSTQTITLSAGETYSLEFRYQGTSIAATPEPATLLLLLAGVLPPVIVRRLRR